MKAMMTVEEALARVIASGAPPLEEEKVALEQAYGRVLARDLGALRTQPPFPNSAMDGYALRAADTTSAPTTLTVIGESAAGRAFESEAIALAPRDQRENTFPSSERHPPASRGHRYGLYWRSKWRAFAATRA